MKEEDRPITTSNVPHMVCVAIRRFLTDAEGKLPLKYYAGKPIYQTLNKVVGYLEAGMVDGLDRSIVIDVRNFGPFNVGMVVTSVVHLPQDAGADPGIVH